MKTALVGYTGFVGANIHKAGSFQYLYNSKNIQTAFSTQPDLLIYAGLPAEKYLANTFPKKDLDQCKNAFNNIKKINAKKTVLISTVDVYNQPIDVDEDSPINTTNLHPYGANRYLLECWVLEWDPTALVIRLPALFGNQLKKNFIFDITNIIPSMLTQEKIKELSLKSRIIPNYYQLKENGFYQINILSAKEKKMLQQEFLDIGFSAINFTDSRAVFQFYWLDYLWKHIQIALTKEITLLNIATEPIEADTIYKLVFNKKFKNEILERPPYYNYRTKYANLFKGGNGYIFSKEKVLEDILAFITKERRED